MPTDSQALTSKHTVVPYWRLSAFYFFYFACLGALVPYWGLYLRHLGFHPQQIGELMAIVMATRIVAPNLWGWIADHTGRRMPVVRLAALFTAICFAGVFAGHGFWWLALVMVGFSFFWNAALPQFEATTLAHLGANSERYSHVRLWGSVGFIVTVMGLGPALDAFSAEILPAVLLSLFGAIWVMSTLVAEGRSEPSVPRHVPLGRVLRRPEVLAFLGACLLMQVSHGPYYFFYSIYLEDQGYARSLIGQLWALGVIAEVGVFLVMHRLVNRVSLRHLLLVSLLLAVLRWWMIGAFPDQLALLMTAQLLHAATFGTYHAASIHLVHRYFIGKTHGRGQALYSSVSFGVGGAIGSLASGYLWNTLGATTTFWMAALISLLGFAVTWRWVREAP